MTPTVAMTFLLMSKVSIWKLRFLTNSCQNWTVTTVVLMKFGAFEIAQTCTKKLQYMD